MSMGETNTLTGAFFTPKQAATRWYWHPESVRRKIRRGEIATVIIGRRRLIPRSEIERIEREGLAACRT